MSVDYCAYYGIGYKVSETDEITDTEDLEDGLEEYIDNECGEGFGCFVSGSAYSGVYDGIYLVIQNPFKDGLDLTAAKERLDKEVARLKLDSDGEFDVVGGLLVY